MKQSVIKLLKKYIPLKEKEIEKVLETPPHPEH